MMERFGVEYDEDEYDFITVSGWVIHELDRIPQVGDTFDYKNLHVTVTRADQRRVHEIQVEIKESEEEA
jgi:CBS domain containing-hemolysin-like protein